MTMLSRYEATVITNLCAALDAGWLTRLLNEGGRLHKDGEWLEFLGSPAAAPVLRAAIAHMSAPDCARVADTLRPVLPDGVFDVDTAAAFAVLAWRGSDEGLSARAIDEILHGCAENGWNLLDIPLETWDGLADLFVAAGPDIAMYRREFAAVLDEHMDGFLSRPDPDLGTGAEFSRRVPRLLPHALRIGSAMLPEGYLDELVPLATDGLSLLRDRRWFLLLLCWAQENAETEFVRRVLSADSLDAAGLWWTYFGVSQADGPGAVDLDHVAADLTYREAMDLRWALDVWRASGAHWPGEPAP
jgi:hypothetical protein